MSRICPYCLRVIMILGFNDRTAKPKITKKPFGKTADGKAVEIYTLTNTKGRGEDHHLWRNSRLAKSAGQERQAR